MIKDSGADLMLPVSTITIITTGPFKSVGIVELARQYFLASYLLSH
jgi:hypothetical protein